MEEILGALPLIISEWGWLRLYFSNGAASDEYPYVEVPMYLDDYADEGTLGFDEDLGSVVLFGFDKQKQEVSTEPWYKVRHTFTDKDGDYLEDDQDLYFKHFPS